MSLDWAAVYAATWEDLVRYLYRKVWNAERARDLAQETFVRALTHEPADPRAWLFTVAANLARDEARAEIRRRRHLALLANDPAVRPQAPDAERELEAGERERLARLALERLGERDRDVLLLWDAGLAYREIAERTGLSPGAIGTTLARARRRLVDVYEEMIEERDAAPG